MTCGWSVRPPSLNKKTDIVSLKAKIKHAEISYKLRRESIKLVPLSQAAKVSLRRTHVRIVKCNSINAVRMFADNEIFLYQVTV